MPPSRLEARRDVPPDTEFDLMVAAVSPGDEFAERYIQSRAPASPCQPAM